MRWLVYTFFSKDSTSGISSLRITSCLIFSRLDANNA